MSAGRPGGILALDLSSRTGWAYGHTDGDPLFGVWILPGAAQADFGRMFVALENEVDDALALHQPCLVVAEAPLPINRQTHERTAFQQLGLAAMVEASAYRANVPARQCSAMTVRSRILGTSRIPKDQVKGAVLRWCALQGWRVPDDNAGDACMLWRFATQHHAELRRPAGMPELEPLALFQ